ncbi:Rha family transcriptional regulator [uncultured Parabacteroides sp.]|jgi:phage regulator Rha-like protein|uniref:Rha family transcriptional regulator n=1 Tax=uncultured Parabacteroides sp. TaxID=512312 RepID=UPI0026007E49|nr:Rha family transcriptional regulator [uncultured Parabacteroides sp.]
MEALVLKNGTMSSVEIAELTGMRHSDVMRAIRNMEPAWIKVNGRNFALVDYPDKKGEKRPCYELNKTECLYIATKFNDEARAKLVLRWEELETEKQKELSPAEIILQMAQRNVENERRMKALENKIDEIEQRTTTDLKCSTVVAYVSRNNLHLDVKRYGAIGTKASNICKKRGIETSKVNDPRWGSVKVYPDEVLAEVFAREEAKK